MHACFAVTLFAQEVLLEFKRCRWVDALANSFACMVFLGVFPVELLDVFAKGCKHILQQSPRFYAKDRGDKVPLGAVGRNPAERLGRKPPDIEQGTNNRQPLGNQ